MAGPKPLSELLPKDPKTLLSNYMNSKTPTDMDQSFKYIEEPDGTMSVLPLRQNENKPLERYFPSALTERYGDGNLQRFNDHGEPKLKKVCALAAKYLNRFEKTQGTGLYIWSQTPGSGKTMLACLLAAAITQKYKVSSQVINTISFFQKAQDVFSDEQGTIEAVMNPVKAVDLLVIDDLGAEKRSEFREDLLYEVINHRLNKEKPIFFTSNHAIEDLHYHPRIQSRITEMIFEVGMPEKDMRPEVRENKNQQIFKSFSQ